MTKTMLVPLDGSPLAARALPYAMALGRGGGHLVLLRVTAPRGWEADPRAEDLLRGELEPAAQTAREAGHTVEIQLEPAYQADVGAAICKVASSRDVDIIVMSTHGRTGPRRLIYGSTADRVLHDADVPVLLVPAASAERWPAEGPLKILVPLDGSELAQEALRPAADLARVLQARILLLRVVEPPTYSRFFPERDLAEARAQLDAAADSLRAEGHPTEVQALVGFSVPTIASVAQDEGAHLIVMATQGRGGLGRLVLGSTAIGTLQHAGVPMALVRPALAGRGVEQPREDAGPVPGAAEPSVSLTFTARELELVQAGIDGLLERGEQDEGRARLARELRERLEPPRAALRGMNGGVPG